MNNVLSKKRNDMKDKIFEVAKNHTENEETAMQLTNELCVLLGVVCSETELAKHKHMMQGSKLPIHGVSESDLLKMIGSESVRTLLRHGFKNPDRSGTGDCDDTCYIDLYRFVDKL